MALIGARLRWLRLAVFCNLICLWSLAYSLTPNSEAPPSLSPDVRVTVSVSEHLVTLSCDVAGTKAGADDHKVQFFCPVLPGDVQCYGDCSPICTMQTDGSCKVMDPILESGESIACQKVVSPSRDAKSVRLRIDTRVARLAGQWRCKFRGTSSATVSLAHYRLSSAAASAAGLTPPSQSPADAAPMAGLTEAPYQSRATAAGSPSDQFGLGVWKPDARKYPTDFAPTQGLERDSTLAKFARIDYIIGVLTVMTASLLLNLGFCIRCILARHYVETRKRNRRKPLGWLSSCLCVSTVQVALDADEAETAKRRQRRRQGDGGEPDSRGRQQLQRQRLLQQQQQPCMYCMQSDCRILYDDVARSNSECGSSCRGVGGGGGGGSFRLAYEAHAGGRGSLMAVPAVPEEAAATATVAAAVTEETAEQQEDTQSDFSASNQDCRLELSRRMLRKADTLLREANSLLLETEATTDQPPEQ